MENIQEIEIIENLLKIGDYDKMFRINYNGQRIYVREEPFEFFSGLTGALSAATFKGDPDAKRLDGWRNSMIDSFGKKAAFDYVDMTADFGTLLHSALVTIKERGRISWSEEKERAYEYFERAYLKKRIEPDFKTIKKMAYEYQKHIASLLQFIHDRVHEIYAIEVPVRWERLKIATPIDLFCSCRQTDKGDFKKTTINLKTSTQISAHQYEQVSCEMTMWNETYNEAAENTAILRTKDWTEGKTPTYEYKYLSATDAAQLAKEAYSRLILCLNSGSSYFPNPLSKDFDGETKIGELPVIITKTLEQEWITTKEFLNK